MLKSAFILVRYLRAIAIVFFMHSACGIIFCGFAQLDVRFNPDVTFQDQPRYLNDLSLVPKFNNYDLNTHYDDSYKLLSGTILPKLEYNPYEIPKFQQIPVNENYSFLNQNYNNYRLYPLSDRTALLLNNRHQVYIGLGVMDNVSGNLLFQPDERWEISLTGAGYRTVDFTGLRTNFTVGGSSRFALTDRLGVNAFGTYVANQQSTLNHALPVLSPMAPRHNYGGTIDFRITDHWGIEGGVKYEFNPFSGKWDRLWIIGPKYYK